MTGKPAPLQWWEVDILEEPDHAVQLGVDGMLLFFAWVHRQPVSFCCRLPCVRE